MSSLTTYKPWDDIERSTHISLRNKYIYFQVSKAASSTVKHYLQLGELMGTPWQGNVVNVNKKYMSPHLSPFQLEEGGFYRILHSKEYKKITFVRNPYTRLLSCYLHRIVGQPSSKSARVLRSQMKIKDISMVSFSDFICFICGQDSPDMESHWRVQYDEALGAVTDFDFVGKLEYLATDIRAMLGLLYGTCEGFGLDDKENKSPMVTGASSKLHRYYTDNLVSLVAKRYKMDFYSFGYSFELPV